MVKRILSVVILAFGLACVGCYSRPPFEPLAQAHQSITRAQMEKADVYFPVPLEKAKQLASQAEVALYGYEYDKALGMARESSALADLAFYKTRLQISSAQMNEAEKSLRILQQTILDLNEPSSLERPLIEPKTTLEAQNQNKE